MNQIEKKVIGITAFGHALCHFYMLILAGALLAIVKDMNSTTAQVTAVGTLGYFLFGLGAFPAGMLVSRSTPKRMLKFYFLLTALASLITAFSGGLTSFAAGLVFLGLFASLYHVSGMTLITHTIAVRGKALGIHGVAGSLGITLTPLIAGLVLSVAGWREIYLLGAVLGLAGYIVLMIDRSIPEKHFETETADAGPRFGKARLTAFGLIMGVMAVNGLVYRGFLTMLPAHVTQSISSGSPLTGGLLATLILSVGMIGQYAGGHLSDRIPMVRLYLITLLCSLPFLFALGWAQHVWIVAAGLFFALFHFPQQPIENHLISRWMPPGWVGSGFGVKFALTFGVGAFASGLTGMIADRSSIADVFPFLAALVAVSSTLIFILMKFLNKHKIEMENYTDSRVKT